MSDRKPNLRAGFDDLLAQVNRRALPENSYQRFLERLDGKRALHRPRRLALLFTSATFASVVVLAVWTFSHHGRRTMAGPFEVAQSSPDFTWRVATEDGAWQASAGYGLLVLREARMRIGTQAGSRLRIESRGIRVLGGTADFEVEPRTTGVPVRVLVSHGAIEVLGTAFWVEQNDRGGKVLLKHGHIRFVPDSGEPRDLLAGQKLSWPLPDTPAPAPAPAPPPPTPEPGPSVAPAPSAGSRPAVRHGAPRPPESSEPFTKPEAIRKYLTEIDALRIRHDYVGLATRLSSVLAGSLHEPLRESLSFELCDVLARKTGERERACAAIAEHLRRYPAGAYTQRLIQQRGAIGCAP